MGFLHTSLHADQAEWQWSVTTEKGRAFLWIPAHCRQVRAVVVGQHNMIEQGILEHSSFRKTLTDLGIAEVWIAPPMDHVFRFDQGAGQKFDAMMQALADVSGYAEIKLAPIIPLGHSACASYPWNFAAWNPGRTLAVLSVHGDAPLTNRTGSGHPNPDWGDRKIDGIPGLMVMGEYEWGEERLQPALDFAQSHPGVPLSMLAEPGSGHFNYDDQLVDFLGMFIRKAIALRLPPEVSPDKAPELKPVNPRDGWLVERWHLHQGRTVPPAPYARYTGGRADAFWCFNEEMANAIQNYSADQAGKLPQLISLTDGHMPAEKGNGEPVNLHFFPDADGLTFHLESGFMGSVSRDPKNGNSARWANLPAGNPLGHAGEGSPITINKIVGPAQKNSGNTFTFRLDRNAETNDRRLLDIWFWACHPGDAKYKKIVQQAVMQVPRNTSGLEQHITFPEIPGQKAGDVAAPGKGGIKLEATSDSGLPVYYYVREGPAKIIEGKVPLIQITEIPPRSRFPVAVTVVAWQWGRSGEHPVKTASPVERTFLISK